MTKINYQRTELGFVINADGHAGYAKIGQDIVCAGVSVLLQTLAYRVMEITPDYKLEISTGHFYLKADSKDALESFNTVLLGLEMLENEYPNHVQVYAGGCPIF